MGLSIYFNKKINQVIFKLFFLIVCKSPMLNSLVYSVSCVCLRACVCVWVCVAVSKLEQRDD